MNTQTTQLPEGPTLNSEYNALLVKWATQEEKCTPDCEECGKDMTGQKVYETPYVWICQACHDAEDNTLSGISVRVSEREDFHSDV